MGIKVSPTPKFRGSFVNVFKPKPGRKRDDGSTGDPTYQILALFPKGTDMTPFKEAILGAIKEKLACDETTALNIVKHPKFKNPIKDQAEMVDKEGTLYAGMEPGALCINLSSKIRPGVVDEQVQDIIDPAEFYSGCYARATVEAFFYDNESRGVSFELHHVQRMAKGESLGGPGARTKPQDDFAPVEVAGSKPATAAGIFD